MNDKDRLSVEYIKSAIYGNEEVEKITVYNEDLQRLLRIIEKNQEEIEELKKDIENMIDYNVVKNRLIESGLDEYEVGEILGEE